MPQIESYYKIITLLEANMQKRHQFKEQEYKTFQKIFSIEPLKLGDNLLQLNSILLRLHTRDVLLFRQLVEAIKYNDPSSTILAAEIQKIRSLIRKLQTFQVVIANIQNISMVSKNQKNLEAN
jgi:division protein CdvB (Snf7/Vps24/ESCRT-III family)